MSDVLHDEWDRAYEEGREVGRREAWSGDYDYRTLMEEARAAALRDAVEAVRAVNSDVLWRVDGYEAIAAIEALGGER